VELSCWQLRSPSIMGSSMGDGLRYRLERVMLCVKSVRVDWSSPSALRRTGSGTLRAASTSGIVADAARRTGLPTQRLSDGRVLTRPRGLVGLLGLGVIFVTVLSLAFTVGQRELGGLGTLDSLFSTGSDSNIPTWFSAVMLLTASLLLAQIALVKQGTDARRWGILALVFAAASIDEVATVHERLGSYLERAELGGLFFYEWVLFGIPLAAILVLAYWRFVLALPRQTKRLVIAAGALFVAGALGAEMVAGLWESRNGADNHGYELITAAEEFLEMTGALVFIYALVAYIESELGGLRIVVGAQTEGEPTSVSTEEVSKL
jgi:hypothetical protein